MSRTVHVQEQLRQCAQHRCHFHFIGIGATFFPQKHTGASRCFPLIKDGKESTQQAIYILTDVSVVVVVVVVVFILQMIAHSWH